MRQFKKAAIAAVVAAALAPAGMAVAQDKPVKMSVVAFLSGAAAGPFGVPSRNGAEVVIAAINAGKLPAPYNSKGLAGREIEAEYIDEAGGNTKQVAEYRNMVEKRGVDVALGYISSGTCAALTPVAEELKKLTVYAICGTPRIFEEAKPQYVFRTMSHATSDNVAAAYYVKEHFPKIKSYTAINQNYAWGQDSWRDFDASMALLTKAKASAKLQWPKIFQGQYSTEISALLLDKAELVHTSLWDGDLESFVFQGQTRGLFKKKKVIFTVAETSVYRLGKRMPDGLVIGARGPYGAIVRDRPSALNKWFIAAYKDRFGQYPSGPAYQYAQAVLAVKVGYDAAAKKAGGFPTQDQVIEAMKGAEFESFSTNVKMGLGNGHQAVTENGYGITKWDAKAGELKLEKVKFYPAECVNPPEGVESVEWIKGGMKGAKC
ncbi:MAG: ABC transporter substrate-binding protein [Betaproteobacteria bacterium SG8_39]|nr:MAG: ABC transporter substrate-binding protein [Betaproteobacteria bacterium SG8_39]